MFGHKQRKERKEQAEREYRERMEWQYATWREYDRQAQRMFGGTAADENPNDLPPRR